MSTVEKITQPTRRFTEDELDIEEEKKNKVVWYVFPEHRKLMRQHRIPVSQDMADMELDRFMSTVEDPENFEKRVVTVVRLRAVNTVEPFKGKRQEYMIWYENWDGTDHNGNPVVPVRDLPQGYDKTCTFSKIYDSEGHEEFKPQKESFVYKVPFTPEALDEILESTNTPAEEVQFIVNGIKSWSGFSYEEFRNLSFDELQQRGKTGKVQEPVEKTVAIPHDNPEPILNKIKTRRKVKSS